MSVYTSISKGELEEFLAGYSIGELRKFAGITSGIENTNYYVTTSGGEYVLTIFEKLPATELPFFLDLMAYLAEHRIPCAHPARNKAGNYLGELKGKPAALVQRLPGRSLDHPKPIHCAAVGEVLARLHLAGQGFPQSRENDRGPRWWKQTAGALFERLSSEDAALLKEELHFQSRYRSFDLPRGIVHADLFRDNVLFEGDKLGGLIDFYYACTDILLFDVAVTANDWCNAADGALDERLTRSLLKAYQNIRPITAVERDAWPAMLRAAALRFWLSRLYDMHFPRPGEITHTKDPEVFKRILINRIDNEYYIRDLWPETFAQKPGGSKKLEHG